MKGFKYPFILLAIFLSAALALQAQDAAGPSGARVKTAAPAKKKIVKKKKKPGAKPVSEYKFDRIDHVPAYTFDKQTNPIIKGAKPKKKKPSKNKKNPPKKTSAPSVREKLKSLPPIEDGGGRQPRDDRQPDTEGGNANG
ncbi:MAG: hypothetical protein A2X28_00860 [Elusimicrobia bacterium GWA2_56_46]|nr:MAG: hypothetical protein A2X28_00860 [Elusimicrobia bacterium GWA2_56_46]OGR55915.1 MAG: hypothetical protein A2X39_06225 [Elusimicrobia bacterium GWC2_56_31]HBB67513.1 hypothetical protein [Elusimicrobiota bacterium]HBW22150.1 hypothetical protein [Elusimicrobiota bacterium]